MPSRPALAPEDRTTIVATLVAAAWSLFVGWCACASGALDAGGEGREEDVFRGAVTGVVVAAVGSGVAVSGTCSGRGGFLMEVFVLIGAEAVGMFEGTRRGEGGDGWGWGVGGLLGRG